MRKYAGIPELLEQFMQEQQAEERWITVQELRDRFGLTRYRCNTVSGFLRRLEFGSYGSFPYIVMRIEQASAADPADPPKYRYLVKRKEKAPAVAMGLMCHTGGKGHLMQDSHGVIQDQILLSPARSQETIETVGGRSYENHSSY